MGITVSAEKKNQCFDVDIGSILEDFKRDYEQKAKVNFTEAALVIQCKLNFCIFDNWFI